MAIDGNSLAIYLHIPFCTTKCTYCAFNTYTHIEHLIPAFVDALVREIEIVGQGNPYEQVVSIYFGGGTPSLLSAKQFETVLDALRRCFTFSPHCEITTEANPNDLDVLYLRDLRSVGIQRLSIGMQSAVQSELDLFARRHDLEQVNQAMLSARNAGFDNISLDLIYGVPRQTLSTWEMSLDAVLGLMPEHISMYALGLEDGTPMKHLVERGRLPVPDDDLAADMYDLATDRLLDAGYMQYEISNWAKPGRICRHNLQYWRNSPYLGLGPGAHGYAAGVRYANLRSPQRYIHLLKSHDSGCTFPLTPVVDEAVNVDRAGQITETLMTNLRLLEEGLSRDAFRRRFDVDVMTLHGETLTKFAGYNLLTIDSEAIKLTRQGRLLSNAIFREMV